MSNFDADAFLSQEVDEQFDTEYTPIPEGEYTAQLKETKVRSYTHKESGEEKPILNVAWNITDPDLLSQMGQETLTAYQTIFPDFSNGQLETGLNKNIAIGQLKELAGIDGPFTFNDFNGVNAIIKIKHEMTDDNRPMAKVKGVAAED